MQYRELNREDYLAAIRRVVVGAEGLHAHSQNVGDGKATIGYGYTFNRNDNTAIWRESGIALSDQQWTELGRIDRAPADDKTRLGLAFGRTLNAAESNQLLEASITRYEGPAERLGMPLSEERVALVSVAYNRGVGALGRAPLIQALEEGNRAESWFQLRYNCWGTNQDAEAGLRKRRIAESQVLGLYDDPANIPFDEAVSVYRMYQLHREEIERVESRWGETIDGVEGRRNLVDLANRDYPTLNRAYGQAPTIQEALAPAKEAMLGHLRHQYPGLADTFTSESFDAGSIHVDAGRDLREGPRLTAEQLNAAAGEVDPHRDANLDAARIEGGREVARNDLLIGGGGRDAMSGGLGDDVLIGGGGGDTLRGGRGSDTYIVGNGDVVSDIDGMGRVFWGDQPLRGGTRDPADPPGTFRSDDGAYLFQMRGSDLEISNRAGETATIRDFQPGMLGVALNRGPEIGEAALEQGRGGYLQNHPLLQQSTEAVARLDAELGKDQDENSLRLAASMALLARTSGFERIDQIVIGHSPSADGMQARAFIVQGEMNDPAQRRAGMLVDEALAVPADDAYKSIEATERRAALLDSEQRDLQEMEVQRTRSMS